MPFCGSHRRIAIDTKTCIACDPETEDALTLELDHIAGKEGFTQAIADL